MKLYIFSGRSRNVDPRLGEKGARAQHEANVEKGVDRILCNVAETLWRREVIAKAAYGIGAGRAATSNVSPNAEQVDQKVARKFNGQHLFG